MGSRVIGAGVVIAVSCLLAGIGLARGFVTKAPESDRVEWDGHRWSEASSEAKLAFLDGFLAGAATSQAYSSIAGDSVFDAELLMERVASLKSERQLNFPYAANLYYVRLHDYYFYMDRRERPLYRAISELNFSLQNRNR